jgi:hypothetical protein
VAGVAGKGARKIGRLRYRAALLALCATLAWLANAGIHASMALGGPLALAGAVCGSVPAPGPDAPCPVCSDALAAGAGPLAVPAFAGPAARCPLVARGRDAAFLAYEVLLDAPARAPPAA